MLTAIEVFDALLVLMAEIGFQVCLVVFIVLVNLCIQTLFKVYLGEKGVPGDDLVKNVEVERQLLDVLDTF